MNWEQLQTILWLRWRLSRNQWLRAGGLGAVLAVLVGLGAFLLGGACFVVALLAAAFGLGQVPPSTIMGLWFGVTAGFLFFWMIGLLTELQRSETIDLQRLMHLPVALGQMFVINYLASHFTLSIVIAVPIMLGLALGLVLARGPEMLLLIPLAMSMVLMITAWTYCLRGWLATLMSNPRRRRTIIMGITFAFILLAQGPNLYFNLFQHHEPLSGNRAERRRQLAERVARQKETINHLVAAQGLLPPFWLPLGARALAEGDPRPALLGTLGGLAIAGLGLRRAYRGTVRFYVGKTGGKAARKIKTAALAKPVAGQAGKGNRFLELRLTGVPEPAAALALATFRSMLRAPEVKMAWASSFLVMLILGASFFFRSGPKLPEAAKPFVAAGVLVFSIFTLVQFLANQFGFDRDGCRALILSPVERRLILLGKNLACLPVGATFGLVLLGLLAGWIHLHPLDVLAAFCQLTAMLLIAALAGNLLSILRPYRVQPGTLKPTKLPGLAILTLVLCQMLFPLAMAPVFVPPLAGLLWHALGWPAMVPVNLLFSLALAGLMAVVYWQALIPLGRLLQQRETKILAAVTTEVE